jgi:hypothetical protein
MSGRRDKVKEQFPEQWLQEVAASFRYPPTPDVAGALGRHSRLQAATRARSLRPVWATLLLLLLLAALLAVPSVRAAVLDFLQIGAIRIFPNETAVTPAETGAGIMGSVTPVSPTRSEDTKTTQGTPNATRTLLDLAGATSWEAAQASARFHLRLPTYPATLGPPDEVYEQQLPDWEEGVPVFILVWRERERLDEVRLALYHIAHPAYGLKMASASAIAETEVNGKLAYWIRDPHRFQLATGIVEEGFFVPGNVLIWVEGEITYRLEGAQNIEEAVRIAESLSPR